MNKSGRGGCAGINRRKFVQLSGAGVAGAAIASAAAGSPAALAQAEYPAAGVAALADLEPGATVSFDYPDTDSPAMLIRMAEAVPGGAGPNRDIVAYSVLCTHKGCPVAWNAGQELLICPCHWSTFDPARSGALVIGQASQPLPRIRLRVESGQVRAVGIDGLIYGRHTNIL